ncbi:tubby-like F-box protein 13 [Lolium perenne]|uniref:tubby-like F-box protein 13 n=1 Tax=Lolium perenne TaxID=4522 RepID=UPI0021F557F4|nr:tubby-like F-box protein 13 [Lolium perenne]XP_051179994.1 tubby-like F-box protein 13 [Lolium perenne]
MSFRSIVRDVRDGFGSLSRRGFENRLLGHRGGKSHGAVHELHDPVLVPVVQSSCWANLPPELLRDVIERLETSEATWPCRKNVVACAGVCRTWREMCKDIVQKPEFCGKITFLDSLKQPGPRNGIMQCFIKRDRSTQIYYLYLSLTSAVLVENGKFLLSAKRIVHATCTEYIISMNADNISRSSNTYIGKMRSNFLGTKFVMYDTQPPYNASGVSQSGKASRRFYSKKGSAKVPCSTYSIAQVSYELNVLGTRGPRRMHCVMQSIPASSIEAGGSVPCQPDLTHSRSLDESFSGMSISKSSIAEHSVRFSSARFSDILSGVGSGIRGQTLSDDDESTDKPLILHNKAPRWHEQLQCWCLNFRGRVTVASVKNFQLTAAAPPAAGAPTPPHPAPTPPPEHDKVILQFGKVAKDMFTMDFRYPLSAFQAFALSLSSFDTKLACE